MTKELGRVSLRENGSGIDDLMAASRLTRLEHVASLEEHPHPPELLVTRLQKVFNGERTQFAEVADQIALEGVRHLAWVAVGTAQRLRDHVIDDAEPLQVAGRQAQRLGGHRRRLLRRFPPEDARASLGTDHR